MLQAVAFEELIQFMRQSEQHISFEVKDTCVCLKVGLYELIGRDNLFPDLRSNPTYSTVSSASREGNRRWKKTKVSIYIDSLGESSDS